MEKNDGVYPEHVDISLNVTEGPNIIPQNKNNPELLLSKDKISEILFPKQNISQTPFGQE